MDTKTLLEQLKIDMARWSRPALVEAYNYCIDHMQGMDHRTVVYDWWYDLREAINAELVRRDTHE